MNRDKWNITKIKHRWWIIRPRTHKTPWIAERVGTYQECITDISHNNWLPPMTGTGGKYEQ